MVTGERGNAVLKGFKEFILRGNVIELAVAVVIGAAFTSVVTSIVNNLINPLIGAVFQADSLDTALSLPIPTLSGETAYLNFGAILGAIISFLVVALVVYFVFVLPMNTLKERAAAKAGITPADEEPKLPTEQEILVQIRDILEAQSTSRS